MLYTIAAKVVIGLFCLPVFVIGVIGNFVVMWLVVSQEHMKTPTNIFIVQLAISDLIILFFCMPFTVTSVYMTENWVFGREMCRTVMFMQVFSVLLSILTLTAMSIERYFKFVHPLKTYASWSIGSAAKICVVIVIVAAALSLLRPLLGGMLNLVEGMPWDPRIPTENTALPECMDNVTHERAENVTDRRLDNVARERGNVVTSQHWDNVTRERGNNVTPKPVENLTHLPLSLSQIQDASEMTTSACVPPYQPVPFLFCFEELGPEPKHIFITVYNSVRIVAFFVLPLLINAYIYWMVKKALSKSNDMFSNLEAEVVEKQKKKTRKLMRMLGWMVAIFAICWLPYQAFLTIQALDDRELFRQEWFQKGMIIVSIFMYLHCISNPIIYYQMNSQFRKGFRRYLCCKAEHTHQRKETASTQVPVTPSPPASDPKADKVADNPVFEGGINIDKHNIDKESVVIGVV